MTLLNTKADSVAQSSMAMVRALESIRSRTPENEVPGWVLYVPKIEDVREIQQFVLAKSKADEAVPLILPREASTTVIVTEGSVSVFEAADLAEPIAEVLPGYPPHFVPAGSHRSILAREYPTTILCVSYREVTRATEGRALPS